MFGGEGSLAVSAASHTAEAARLVQAFLLAFGAKESSVSKLAQYAGALHGGLEPLKKAFRVLAVA